MTTASASVAPPRPPVTRIPGLLHRAAAEFADAPFVLRWDGAGFSGFSFGAAALAVRDFAGRLTALGVRPGMLVALRGENRPEWGLAYLGILEAGAVAVPLDVQLGEGDTGEILAACRAAFAVASRGQAETLARAAAARGLELHVIAIEEIGRSPGAAAIDRPQGKLDPAAGAGSAASASSSTRRAPAAPPAAAPAGAGDSGDDLAALLFTSGTTGRAKGVMLTHANVLHNVEAIVTAFHFDHGDRLLSVLPLHHAFECTAGFLAPLRAGASIAYARSLKSTELREDLYYSRATIMLGVPLLYEKLLAAIARGIDAAPQAKRAWLRATIAVSRALRRAAGIRAGRRLLAPLRARAGLATLRMFVTGAAPLRPETFWGFVDLGFLVLEGYGLTECAPVVCANRPESARPGGVGWPLPGIEVRIAEPDERGAGEIVVRGPNVMRGYFGDPAATAEVLRDGEFRTGDLGRLLEDGRLVITGRRKNLIVTAAGKKIYPEEVEALLSGSRLIEEVAVVAGRGAHGEREEVHAHVVPALEAIETLARAQGRPADAAFVREALEREVESFGRRLAPFKRVKKVIVHRGELPKTTTGKIRRDALGPEESA